jgi:hypothetical protein
MAATVRNVDLSGVKEGGTFRPKRKPEADYKAKVVKADDHTSKKNADVPGWVLTIQVDGDARSSYPYYLSSAENQLWKIRQVCIACGLKVGSARVRFDPNKLVNKALGIALIDDEFEGKVKSTIDDVFPVSEVGGNAGDDDIDVVDDDEVPDDEEIAEAEDEEEEVVVAPVRRRKAAPEPEVVEDDDEDEEEEPPAPVKRRRKPAPEPEPVDDEEDEDEEPPAPVRKRRTTPPTKAVAPARTRKAAPVVEDDDDDLDLDDLDD